MISVTYISTATAPFTPEQAKRFLAFARERNHAEQLTGMLLYAGGHFIQTLEGPEEAVDAALVRIEHDARHRNVEIVLREEIEERTFPDWSMGFQELCPEEASVLPGFNDYLAAENPAGQDSSSLSGAEIFHRVFRRTMR